MKNLRLTVKNYKIAEWASEETDCYTASLYLDGKRIGTAQNDGHGGADFYDFVSPDAKAAFEEYVEEWVASVQDDPKHQINGKCYAGAESLVAEACEVFRRQKEMKRRLKGYAMVVRIERPEGWSTRILEVSLPAGHDPADVLADHFEEGDSVYLYDADSGVREWTGDVAVAS